MHLKIILLSLIIVIANLNCVSNQKQNKAQQVQSKTSVKTKKNSLNDNWEYKIEKTKAGTRSQGELGKLLYKDQAIPAGFKTIIIDQKQFEYVPFTFPWKFKGYKRVKPAADVPTTSNKITKKDLAQGWYLAGYKQKKAGTPAKWIWVQTKKKSAYISPDKLNAFAAKAQVQGTRHLIRRPLKIKPKK